MRLDWRILDTPTLSLLHKGTLSFKQTATLDKYQLQFHICWPVNDLQSIILKYIVRMSKLISFYICIDESIHYIND